LAVDLLHLEIVAGSENCSKKGAEITEGCQALRERVVYLVSGRSDRGRCFRDYDWLLIEFGMIVLYTIVIMVVSLVAFVGGNSSQDGKCRKDLVEFHSGRIDHRTFFRSQELTRGTKILPTHAFINQPSINHLTSLVCAKSTLKTSER
jgi:hypothetical protein